MKRIAVLVSGGGTNLQALIDAQKRDEIHNGEIALVLSSSSKAYALTRAEENGIPSLVMRKRDFPDRDAYSAALAETLAERNIDLVVLAGFMLILTQNFAKAFPNRIINVHPALIPSFCGEGFYGLHVHEAALKAGVKLTGATVHFVNEVCDGGPIILQGGVPVLEGDTPEILQKRVMEEAEWKLLPKAVSYFCEDRLSVDENGIVHIAEGKE